MIQLNEISLARGSKELFSNASVTLYEKQKIGLIGQNGCGKTTLFNLLLGNITPNSGTCFIKSQLRIGYLAQTIPNSDESALSFVLAGDALYMQLIKDLTKAEEKGDNDSILQCHDKLNLTGGYSKPALATSILAGLGFAPGDEIKPVQDFSGGWRMRLALARCLITPSDLLLLDEPTNHLDIEAAFWLEKWLKNYPGTVLLISHDREFLDHFASHILHIENQQFHLYKGNYSYFEKARAEKINLQQKRYEKQQSQIEHMMSYVHRFKAKANKAKQAQSRLNAIAKMDLVVKAQTEAPFHFEFFPSPKANHALITCKQLTLAYDPNQPVLKDINFQIHPGDRFALLGRNGQGKSTFIKALTGILPSQNGEIIFSQNLKIAYYAQHQLEDLDLSLSPIETIQVLTPEAREQSIRNFLGGFNFHNEMATQAITHFSGGEKARLALAKLVWLKPNLLLLDEPTNHLDLDMRAAIALALQSYEGALILVSHDRHLLKTTVDQFFIIAKHQLNPFDGDLEDYHQLLQQEERNSSLPGEDKSDLYKEKRKIQNRVKKIEALLESCQSQLKKVEEDLSNPALYEKDDTPKVQKLYEQQVSIKAEISSLEEEWLSLLESND